MFHKRLLKEFQDNIKYVVGMVAPQWVSLIANVVLMLLISGIVASFIEGQSMKFSDQTLPLLLVVFVTVFLV